MRGGRVSLRPLVLDLPFFNERVGLPDKLGFGGLEGVGGVFKAAEPVEDLLLQVWAEVLEFHLQLKVQEDAHLMVHPIHQKKVEEVNQ